MIITYLQALGLMLGMGLLTWVYSVYRRDVSIVDSLWSLMFLAAAVFYFVAYNGNSLRSDIVLGLITLWALRLSIHLTIRNWNKPEDRRYQEIRRNNEPNFEIKSLYLIFGLQALLAWIISVPLLLALDTAVELQWIDLLAITLWLVGFFFEAVADWQLYRFQQNPANAGKVLDTGLWRYSRHPNYFGEFCIWWSYFLLALPAGGWWTVYAPLLMTFLLLKISGVILMEKDISKRRPEYQSYIRKTNAFFPSRPRTLNSSSSEGQAA